VTVWLNNCLNNAHQKADFHSYCLKGISKSIFIEPTDANELLRLVSNLRKSKSPGPDNIGPGMIKEVIGALTDPLLHIYFKSLLEGIFPDRLKMTKVVPIYRKGDKSLASNYRPISLLSVFD